MHQHINVELLLLLDSKLHVLVHLLLVCLVAELAILVCKACATDLCMMTLRVTFQFLAASSRRSYSKICQKQSTFTIWYQ